MGKFEDDLKALIASDADGRLQLDIMQRMWDLGLRGKAWDNAVADCFLDRKPVVIRKKKRG